MNNKREAILRQWKFTFNNIYHTELLQPITQVTTCVIVIFVTFYFCCLVFVRGKVNDDI